jgi:hypothetical protein
MVMVRGVDYKTVGNRFCVGGSAEAPLEQHASTEAATGKRCWRLCLQLSV